MKSAYDVEWLYNLAVIKESRNWFKQELITSEQLSAIHQAYPCGFYHPNFVIRMLLFVATLLALSGVTGLLGLLIADIGERAIGVGCLLYGIASFLVLDIIFISRYKHYKTGVTEALIYHSCLFTIIGLSWMGDFDSTRSILVTCCFVFLFAALRYLDLICTLAFIVSLVLFIFFEAYNIGEVMRQGIPFVMMSLFVPLYFYSRKLSQHSRLAPWNNNLVLVEGISLIIIYLAGNYLVVRELSIELMGLTLEKGGDIPFAIIFYALTIIIPVTYLYFGLRKKDVVLLRVSLILIAFSVFTFKYYYGFGHPEITLTIAGAILTLTSVLLLNYLRVTRHGYTREKMLSEKWADSNLHAFIVSQTMGGNHIAPEQGFEGGGGEFGGGGASGKF